jgi:hypothetical protein
MSLCNYVTMIYSETYKNVYVRPGEGKHVRKVSNPSLSVVRDLWQGSFESVGSLILVVPFIIYPFVYIICLSDTWWVFTFEIHKLPCSSYFYRDISIPWITFLSEWVSFNIHLKKSVWSTWMGRITPTWNPLPNSRVRSYEERDSVVVTLSPHNVTMLQGHRYLDPPILYVQRRLRVKRRHPDSQNSHL